MKKRLCIALYSLFLLFQQQVEAQTLYVYENPIPVYATDTARPVMYFVTEDPPPYEIVPIIGPPTDPTYVWIRGNWQWNGCRWKRLQARCIPTPTPYRCIGPGVAMVLIPGCSEPCFCQWARMKYCY